MERQLRMDMGVYESELRKGSIEKQSITTKDYVKPKGVTSLPTLGTPRACQKDLIKMPNFESQQPTIYQSQYQLNSLRKIERMGPRPNETAVLRDNKFTPSTMYKDTIGTNQLKQFQRSKLHDPYKYKSKQCAFQLNLPFIDSTTTKKAFQAQRSKVQNMPYMPMRVSQSLLTYEGQFKSNYSKQHKQHQL